ncbi:MAG: ECF transporter S component [Oscillospiraceae bacterium]|nr:ECF transporter S component [Oscillospiraceae bacterium]
MEKNIQSNQRITNTQMNRKLSIMAMLTAMAAILMFFERELPLMPGFLKFDLSEIPILIGAFAFGPLSAIMMELVKNLIHLPFSTTAGVGQFANFVTGILFAGTAGLIYQRYKTRKGAVLSMAVGTLVMTVGTSFLNYFLFLRLYGLLAGFPLEAIIGMAAKVNPNVADKESLIVWAFIPFNLFKGLCVSILTFMIYKPISTLIHTKTSPKTQQNCAPQ